MPDLRNIPLLKSLGQTFYKITAYRFCGFNVLIDYALTGQDVVFIWTIYIMTSNVIYEIVLLSYHVKMLAS